MLELGAVAGSIEALAIFQSILGLTIQAERTGAHHGTRDIDVGDSCQWRSSGGTARSPKLAARKGWDSRR